jgi:hypothetical protein
VSTVLQIPVPLGAFSPLRVLVSISVFVLGACLGVLWTVWRMSAAADHAAEAARREEREQRLWDASEQTDTALARALTAHTSLRVRLRGLADSESITHTRCRTCTTSEHRRGVAQTLTGGRPRELSRDLPRPGDAELWQALDRSFDPLLAIIDEPGSSLADQARAYTAVGDAARAIADRLAGASAVELAAGCSFSGKERRSVGTLIAGPGIYICDECVALAIEVLEDNAGPGWREDAERRLRGDDDES